MLAYLLLAAFMFELKHVVADGVLQTNRMVDGKRLSGWDWILPLSAHASVHGLGSMLVLATLAPKLWYLALVDFGTHVLMDRVKVLALRPRRKSRMAFGKQLTYTTPVTECQHKAWMVVDQVFHHVVHFSIAIMVAFSVTG